MKRKFPHIQVLLKPNPTQPNCNYAGEMVNIQYTEKKKKKKKVPKFIL